MKCSTPSKNGSVTEVQSNTGVGRPLPVPTPEELPPLLARSPLAIVDEALTLLRINPGLFFGLSAMVLLPLQLIVLVLPGSSLRGNRPDRTADIIISSLDQPSAVGNALGTLIFESLGLFIIATIYGQIVALWYSGRSMTPTDLLLASIKRLPVVVGAWTLGHLVIVAAGLASLGIFGLLIAVYLIVLAPAIGAEGVGVMEGVRRSRKLTQPRYGPCILMYVMVAVGGQVMDISLRVAPTFVFGQLNLPIWIIGGVTDVLASIVVVSFTAATSVVLYLDLRVRREGIDLYMAVDRDFAPSALNGRNGRPARG